MPSGGPFTVTVIAESNLSVGSAVIVIFSFSAHLIDWAVDADPVGPWYGQRKGKDGVGSFFADIAGATDLLDFAVEGMRASDNEVFAFLRFAVRMKSKGREASFHSTTISGSAPKAKSSTTAVLKIPPKSPTRSRAESRLAAGSAFRLTSRLACR